MVAWPIDIYFFAGRIKFLCSSFTNSIKRNQSPGAVFTPDRFEQIILAILTPMMNLGIGLWNSSSQLDKKACFPGTPRTGYYHLFKNIPFLFTGPLYFWAFWLELQQIFVALWRASLWTNQHTKGGRQILKVHWPLVK